MPRNSEATTNDLPATAGAGRQVTNVQKNYFEQYGEQASQRTSIVGSLLKFSKGDWLLGQDEEEIPVGTRYVAHMDSMLVGWVKWLDNKPVEQVMGKLSEGYQAPKRDTLGDTDKEHWELDAQGKERDPWQFSNLIIMKPVGKKFSNDNAITFTTSSKGGIGAVGKLCMEYGKEVRTKAGQCPIVQLGVDAYNHPNKEYGRIKTPILELVGWEKSALFDIDAATAAAEPEAAPARNGGGGGGGRSRGR